jgi:NADH dehydrogenase FAD-containing subunit
MKAPRIVALGGGHGLYATLSAARRLTPHVTAVVTVADVAVYATFVTCATCGPKDENAQKAIFSDVLALQQCDERHGSQHMQDTVPRRLFGSARLHLLRS